MFAERLIWVGLGEHVGRLFFAVDCIDRNLALINVVSEVVVLDIDVFGAQADLGYGCNFDCTAVVFQNLAVNGWLGATKPEA